MRIPGKLHLYFRISAAPGRMEAVLPNPKTAMSVRQMKVSSLLFRNAIKRQGSAR
ncbi:MAG: hypothetical protein J6F33_03105 [Acidaminococcaceae bacterium]|nr:hypothetical protein [Acidaminococcaceae bacterium]